jgi:ribulose bisphosphate carboxylase small subunit
MTVLSFRTGTYARNIYLYGDVSGTRFSNIPTEYVEPVKQYAATNFSDNQIQNALTQGWIAQQEFDDTMAYKPVA